MALSRNVGGTVENDGIISVPASYKLLDFALPDLFAVAVFHLHGREPIPANFPYQRHAACLNIRYDPRRRLRPVRR
jgi:hypothetical protein